VLARFRPAGVRGGSPVRREGAPGLGCAAAVLATLCGPGLRLAPAPALASAAQGGAVQGAVQSVPTEVQDHADDELDAWLRALGEADGARARALCDERLASEPALLERLCLRFRAAPTDPLRRAIHALTLHGGAPRHAENRERLAGALARALEADVPSQAAVAPAADGISGADPPEKIGAGSQADRDNATQTFLIEQLELIGGGRAVPAVAKQLTHPALCEAAARALVAIGGREAGAALRQALREARPAQGVPLITALGDLRDQDAAPPLLQLLNVRDAALTAAAFDALCRMGDERVFQGFTNPLIGSSKYEEWRITGLVLRLRREQAAAGQTARSRDLLRQLLASARNDGDWHLGCACLYGLAEIEGADAVPELLLALRNGPVPMEATARQILLELPGADVTAALCDALPALPPEPKAGLIGLLGRRGDAAALSVVAEALREGVSLVRIEAVRAVGRLSSEEAPRLLIPLLGSENRDEREATEAALVRLSGAPATAGIAAALRESLDALAEHPSAVQLQVGLLGVLARRPPGAGVEEACRALERTDAMVSLAGVRALTQIGDGRALAPLLRHLEQGPSEQRRETETALARVCRRAGDANLATARIIAALHAGDDALRASLIRVLGGIGGAAALATVTTFLDSDDANLRDAAVRAMADWPEAAAAPWLLERARATSDLSHHVLMLRGYVRLVTDTDMAVEARLDALSAALAAARRVTEKQLVISRLADVAHPRTLRELTVLLDDAKVATEAAVATVSAAGRLARDFPAETRAALEAVQASEAAPGLREQLERTLRDVEQYEDYITDWLVSGPYARPGTSGADLFDVAFPPEQPSDAGGTGVTWGRLPPRAGPQRAWRVDLNATMNGSDRAAYLRTAVWSPRDQSARLEVGSDDGAKVWWNGALVAAKNVPRGCVPGEDKVDIALRAGWNELLLKVVNGAGAWAACARVRDADGSRIEGLRVDSAHLERERRDEPSRRE
jgi:HEAT repeat protein